MLLHRQPEALGSRMKIPGNNPLVASGGGTAIKTMC